MNKKLNKVGHNLRQLIPFVKPYKWQLIGAVIMIIGTVISLGTAPRVEGMITTNIANDVMDMAAGKAGAGVRFDVILRIFMILGVIYLIKTATQIASVFLLTNAIQNAMHDLRNALQSKIRRLPVKYFDTNSFGDILSRITNDVESISAALQQSFSQIISGMLTLTFAVVMMLSIEPMMAVIVLVIIPASILISKTIIKISQKQFNAQQKSLGDLNGFITERYTGFREVLLYNKQGVSIDDFKEKNETLRTHAFRAQFLSSLMNPFVSLVTYIVIGAVATIGAIGVIDGTMTLGNLQAFVRYIWQVNDPLSQVTQLSSQIQAAFAAMDRVFEVLNAKEEVKETTTPKKPDTVKGEVCFEGVSFGYDKENIITNLNLKVKSGQMVAIVGPTGAGKTTLINLLLRFYDVGGGRITIDGVDIRDMKRNDLRGLFGMVLQDTWLFAGSIYDNIRYGRPDARKDEVIEAAKAAKVHRFIRTLPNGYDMMIDEDGGNISQGEKQLLTIARAMLKNPDIMILDEATSSVDTRIEKMLQEVMHKVMEGRTSFVIAHRLSTIKNADVILVLDNGNIVEQGTHAELLEKKGRYEQLYHSQFANK